MIKMMIIMMNMIIITIVMDYEHHDNDHDNDGNNNDDYDLVALQIFMENVINKQCIDGALFLTCYHH